MSANFSELLAQEQRLLLAAELQPVQGQRFQPTGFPDIGAAVYQRPDGAWMLLVESAQSIANRLEQTIIGKDNELISDFAGLPYIRVRLVGNDGIEGYTNSLVEAHRINSPFIIKNKDFRAQLVEAMGYKKGRPVDWKKVAGALVRFDINSLIHGTFLSNLDGRLRITRMISGFIEAEDVREAVSGGVKNSLIDPQGKLVVADDDKDVYGNVPYQKMEYTAKRITAYFNLDLSLLRSYGLAPSVEELLVALILYKIRAFLDSGLRLRTACDLKCTGVTCSNNALAAFSLPGLANLRKSVQDAIAECQQQQTLPPKDEAVTEITTQVKEKKNADQETASTDEEAED